MCCCKKMITKLKLIRLTILFNLIVSFVLSQNCDKISSSHYQCFEKNEKCMTYAILRANSHYSSLSNLTSRLSIGRADLLEANGFSNDVEFLSEDQPVLIPIECKCSSDGIYGAELLRISVKGESFFDIAESLEGLTTCSDVHEKNPIFSPWNVPEGVHLLVPLRCACPVPTDSRKLLVSYPVKGGDTLVELAEKFNVNQETLVSANSIFSTPGFRQDGNLVPIQTVLIPLERRPVLGGFLSKLPEESIRVRNSHKRKKKQHKMWMIGVYVAVGIIGFLACVGVALVLYFTNMKKKREMRLTKNGSVDLEVQQLSLSIRTTSDKKVSFEGSQYNLDEANTYTTTTTPHKMRIESYTFEDLQKATEDFSSTNLIEGSVFHGRLKGKNMAIKRVSSETISKIDYENHRHPNIMRLLGTCLGEGVDSFIVFEYAKNGSLKDWIHGGLAMKSHFVASCSCFLTWNQRVRICVDVATALQHMHHIMNPSYVHRHINSRNIFLDEDFTAKIGYFGLAKLADDDCTSTVLDSGYLAPEYLSEGTISPSTDVFAFGIVLLEVLSGKPPLTQDEENEGEGENFVKLSDEIKGILKSEDAEELRGWIDGALGENYSFDAAVTLANLARSCVEDDASLRPNAGEIMEKLLRLVEEEVPERDQFIMCESSCKPLVNAAAK